MKESTDGIEVMMMMMIVMMTMMLATLQLGMYAEMARKGNDV